MDSFEFNKVAGAILASVLLVLVVKNVADYVYDVPEADEKAFVVEGVAEEGHGATGEAEAGPVEEPLPVLLAKADIAAGEKSVKKCQSCHNFEEGAGAKIGPDLYHIVGRPKAGVEGFAYSAALKEKGGVWTFEDLNHFIANPKEFVKGTIMSFAGIRKPQERANVIAYLNTLGSNEPLPAVEESAAPAEEAAPAGEAPAEASPAEPAH